MTDTLAAAAHNEAGSGDPAEAFDALRARVEAQGAANTAGFQAMGEHLKVVADRQAEMAKSPALRQTPMQIADDQVRQRAEMLERVQNEWREPIRHANAEWNGLVKMTSGMRARSHQNWWLAGAGVAGLLLWPVLIMSLNTSASTRLVTWTLGYTDQWKAGNHLMHKANLTRMQNWTAAGALWDANLDAINACTAVPLAPGKKRVCALVLPDNQDVQK